MLQGGGGITESPTQDSKEVKKVNLGRSVVSATGYEQDIKNAPASISVIEKEEIMTRPVRDIGDIVQDVPGVYTEATKVGGNEIKMRGLGTEYTLILIDGKRQNVAQGFDANGWAGTFSGFMPPASMIERVEVIRGPASVIYGSDAMGGVINIITKKHSNTFDAGMQLDTRLPEHSEFGNQYGVNGYVNIPLIKDMLSLNLRGGYKYGDQNGFLKPAGLTLTNAAARNNPYATWSATGFTNWNAGGRLNFTPNKNNYIYLDSEVYFARTGSLNTSGNQITAVRDFYKLNNVLSHEADYDWGKLTSFVQYSQTFWGPHANVPIGGTHGTTVNWGNKGNGKDNKDVIVQTNYFKDIGLGNAGNILFNGGLYYMWEQLIAYNTNPANRSNKHMNQVAAFAEGEYLVNEYFSTTLGLRYNYSDIFNATPNPRFYVNFNPTDWLTFKAGIASGVLVPQMSNLYDGYTLNTSNAGTVATFGNKDLQPEKSWNYELSGIIDTESAMFILTGYYTDFRDQIATYSLGQGQGACDVVGAVSCNFYHNVAKSYMTGAEVGLKVKPIYGFSLDSSYGFTHTEVLEAQNAASAYTVGEPVSNIPRHNFTITPRYAYKDFSMYIRWSGKYKTPTSPTNSTTGTRNIIGKYYKDYQLVDIAATYKLSKQYSLTLAVNNLFDVDFFDYVIHANQQGVANAGYTNNYQRWLPSRSYWISFRADW
ncbi:TonB-dependent receptor [Helicobacter jaachi]|uniref:TonB-dependent receptor n=1 Tax=Helicobacter jaachi TaxID=1677920 RepID=A0A4U8T8R0_9HELI|nr:TonB-dependent receptor [Helicobacter jaachi]TLD95107.1 TonB-dependent receptor [Helicobacter jaachi]